MNFIDLAQKRYSVRGYTDDPVEPAKLDAILLAAQWAPTAANRQPLRLFVIETQKHREALKELYARDWFVQPPLVLAIAAVLDEAWTRKYDDENYAVVDATIAFDHMILQAVDLGLGTCWIAAFDPDKARQLLNLPDTWKPVAFTPLGYPADAGREKKRRELEELVHYIR